MGKGTIHSESSDSFYERLDRRMSTPDELLKEEEVVLPSKRTSIVKPLPEDDGRLFSPRAFFEDRNRYLKLQKAAKDCLELAEIELKKRKQVYSDANVAKNKAIDDALELSYEELKGGKQDREIELILSSMLRMGSMIEEQEAIVEDHRAELVEINKKLKAGGVEIYKDIDFNS